MSTLKFYYRNGNDVNYNHSELDEEGMASISLFNNDFGYKIFKYNEEIISINLRVDYFFVPSFYDSWNIEIKGNFKLVPGDDFQIKTLSTISGKILSSYTGIIYFNQ
jgi:hypothetical protein